MKNNKRNPEQIKAEKFFDTLWDKSLAKSISWFVVGIFLFLMMIASMLPAQELYVDVKEDGIDIMAGALTMFSFMAVAMRTSRFRQYTENQKSRTIKELLQYYPISKREIWKVKMQHMCIFLAKVTVLCLSLQCIVSFIAYGEITWLNFFYIFICVFLFPIVGELVFDSITKAFLEE